VLADLVNCASDTTLQILNKVTGTSSFTSTNGFAWAPWKINSVLVDSSVDQTGPFPITDSSEQTYEYGFILANGTEIRNCTVVIEIPKCYIVDSVVTSEPAKVTLVPNPITGGTTIYVNFNQTIVGDGVTKHFVTVSYHLDTACAENACNGYCPGGGFTGNFTGGLVFQCNSTCCLCVLNNGTYVQGNVTITTINKSVTAGYISIGMEGQFIPGGQGRPIGSICWKSTPQCSPGRLDLRPVYINNTIPDGLDAIPGDMTNVNNGILGTFNFVYLDNFGNQLSQPINLSLPFATIVPGPDCTNLLQVNVTRVYEFLGIRNLSYPCPISIDYCTGIKQFYCTGKTVSDCDLFVNRDLITTDVYFQNGSLADTDLT